MKKFRIWVLAVLLGLVPFAGCEKPKVPVDKTEEPDNSGAGGDKNDAGSENPDNGNDGTGDNGSGSQPKVKEFVILFTNDFHSQIEPLS